LRIFVGQSVIMFYFVNAIDYILWLSCY